eukprot:GHVH01017502.1.p1 GENE.GHVH01017502.1~~GHVH01017502.1.p1  ORF type:complete len:471 (+),score=65.14 GHVH01017502.1:27-1415(+)
MGIDANSLRSAKGGNPEEIREAEKRRCRSGSVVDRFIEKDEAWKSAQYEMENMKKDLNANNKKIGARKKVDKSDKCEDLVSEVASCKARIADIEKSTIELKATRDTILGSIGNPTDWRVPIGKNEEECNAIIRTWGDDLKQQRSYKCDGTPGKMHHHEILERLGGYNPKKGAEVAGHRGYYLLGAGAEFNQALVFYAQKYLRSKGYTTVQVPFFMKKSYMAKAAELADFEETLYRIPAQADDEGNDANREDMFLIATSEQPLCCLHANEVVEESQLPLKYAGVSTCFRKEAGSHGKDCWGIFRIHQFEKVEQFIICDPEKSKEVHEDMIHCSEEFMKSLGLPFQTIAICSGALNDAAAMKYDIEAWFPGYEAYRELVSCSNCTDFQSRELNIPCGYSKQGEREKKYVHMLNGTLCATERTLCCILENYQTEEGVRVPEVLIPYMDGKTFIPFKNMKQDPTPQ